MPRFVQLVFGLVVLGVVLYIVEFYLPIDGFIKMIIRVVVILGVCAWLLNWRVRSSGVSIATSEFNSPYSIGGYRSTIRR